MAALAGGGPYGCRIARPRRYGAPGGTAALGGGPSRTGPNHGVTDVRFSSYSWCPAVHLSRSHGESGRQAVVLDRWGRWRQHCGQNWPWPPTPLISSLGLDHYPSHHLGCSGRQHQRGRLRAPLRRCMIDPTLAGRSMMVIADSLISRCSFGRVWIGLGDSINSARTFFDRRISHTWSTK